MNYWEKESIIKELTKTLVERCLNAEIENYMEELAAQVQATDQVETVYKIVHHLAVNNRGITLDGDRQFSSRLQVSWQG
ncbi:MAG: hypothetical protein ACK58N_07920 [Synechocystis sp.]|jgi:glucose-6-phosphate isomerase